MKLVFLILLLVVFSSCSLLLKSNLLEYKVIRVKEMNHIDKYVYFQNDDFIIFYDAFGYIQFYNNSQNIIPKIEKELNIVNEELLHKDSVRIASPNMYLENSIKKGNVKIFDIQKNTYLKKYYQKYNVNNEFNYWSFSVNNKIIYESIIGHPSL